ncbi:hypothetical protein Bbelb_021620 [Branchiostoma belcheri]|nr:hypothetical protein Bbelb_021620 [Branchiostoma belcheri]
MEEYIAVKSKLKLGKAAYPDGIPPEALKLCDFHDIMLSFASNLFLEISRKKYTIKAMAALQIDRKIHPWKRRLMGKKGELAAMKKFKADQKAVQSIPTVTPGWVYNKTAADLFRGITLLSIPGKLFTRILLARAMSAIRSSRRPQQTGFMPNRSTIDHISALRLVIEKAREYRKDRHLYIAFVDLRAAFDTVDHASLWKILTTIGVSPKIIALFQLLYSDAESCVRVNDKNSDWFQINSGVRQGCVAAPDLFNCVVDYLMSKVSECVPGVSFGGYSLADLEYADDTTLLADTPQRLRDALAVFDAEAAKLGLSINWSKTELMHIGNGPDHAPFSFNNITVNFVSTFNYLGSTVSRTGDLKPEIDRRRGLAAAAMQALWRPLWKHRHISLGTKLRVYNAAVVSILMYGAETWPLSNTLAARLDGFDSRCLRRILGVRWFDHLPGTELRQRTQQPPASRVAAMRRVRWYGHVLRLPPDHPTQAILNFSPQSAGWKRPRGAPRTRWSDVLAKDLALVNITHEEAQGLAQDRSRWKEVVHLACFGLKSYDVMITGTERWEQCSPPAIHSPTFGVTDLISSTTVTRGVIRSSLCGDPGGM